MAMSLEQCFNACTWTHLWAIAYGRGLAVRPERKHTVITLKGHAALVTGSTKGVGRAIAITMAEAGADVVVHGRVMSAEARETMDRCGRHGVKVAFAAGDLSGPTGAAVSSRCRK